MDEMVEDLTLGKLVVPAGIKLLATGFTLVLFVSSEAAERDFFIGQWQYFFSLVCLVSNIWCERRKAFIVARKSRKDVVRKGVRGGTKVYTLGGTKVYLKKLF